MMIKVKIFFEGPSVMDGVKSGDELEVEHGTTVSDLLGRCNVLEEFQAFIIPFVNDEHAEASYELEENDECKLFLPVSGG